MSSKARGLADLGNAYDDGALSNRNLIINGAMQVAQRGDGPFTNASGGYQTVDRFQLSGTMGGSFTLEQATDAPSGSGFQKSFKALAPTGFSSPTASASAKIITSLEGQNLQQLLKGTSDAVSVTASFWVKAVVTGTYIFEVYDEDNSRTISTAYSISASNTWEKKTITISGDTSGALGNDNGKSLSLIWWIGAGSNFTSGTLNTSWNADVTANRAAGQVNAVASNNDAFYITGVQLEVGDTATPFEHRSFGEELALCQRYFQQPFKYTGGSNRRMLSGGYGDGGSTAFYAGVYQPMRAAPTATSTGSFMQQDGGSGFYDVTMVGPTIDGDRTFYFGLNGAGVTVGNVHLAIYKGASSINLDAEL